MKTRFVLGPIVFLGILIAIGAVLIRNVMLHGFSVRTPPTGIERALATTVRRYSIPPRYKYMKNPVQPSPTVLHAAEEHWADHCATCHADNGTGETMLGRTMYPRPPDMRLPQTQFMSDGELYYTIQYGVRLSGMPAFGDPVDNDSDTWKLVTFIRHLPHLTLAEELEMEGLNPKSPDEMQEDQQEEDFLNGAPAQPKSHNRRKDHTQ